jgi:cytochrome c-type biogenesis protein CcmH
MNKIIFSLLIFLALLGLASRTALAQTPAPPPQRVVSDDEVNAVAKQMYCPVCENTPLDVCPTQACAEWRELIRQKLAAGETEVQIKQYFVDRFGDRVLATPPARGLNWLVYVIPPLAILVGVFFLYQALRAYRRQAVRSAPASGEAVLQPPAADAGAAGVATDPYLQRMEEELRKKK